MCCMGYLEQTLQIGILKKILSNPTHGLGNSWPMSQGFRPLGGVIAAKYMLWTCAIIYSIIYSREN